MKISPFLGGLIVAACAAGWRIAQSAAPPPTPQPGAPPAPTDVKPIGDWTVRCSPVTSTSPCDMYEELDDKNSRQRVLGVSIAFVPGDSRHVAQIAVPLGVACPRAPSSRPTAIPRPRCRSAAATAMAAMSRACCRRR